MSKIKVAIVGVGNCASSLVQGITYYRQANDRSLGLMHWDLGGYEPTDIEFVLAYDIDERKVGTDLSDAIFAPPNCTAVFANDLPQAGVKVEMGAILDGVADHMPSMPADRSFVVGKGKEPSLPDVAKALKDTGADILINFLPVGSETATKFYMQAALDAGVGVVNCMPVFIASDPEWEQKFRERNLPIVGDDVKAQIGATIVHRTLSNLMKKRGVRIDRTYQLNTGGNTDFLNMADKNRLSSKKISKTEAVQSVLAERLKDENIHVGPSDYVPWLNDNKLCFLRLEGRMFGGVPMNIELRLSVEDSPNSAGVVIDAIRCAMIAKDRNHGGAVVGPSAYFCKHPPLQFDDDQAERMVEAFIHNDEALEADTPVVILAAGQGLRLRSIAPSKPLAEVVGTPLIERVVERAMQGGAREFVVVTGHEGERVGSFVEDLSNRRSVAMTPVHNEDYTRPNGLSVLKAEEHVGDRFVVMMCDHLFEPQILRDLMRQPLGAGELILAVDKRMDNPLVDKTDVTRVDVTAEGRIRRIGKHLEPYNAYDTGIFLCSPSLFEAIRYDVENGGSGSLSEAVQRLADQGLAKTFDIGGRFWIDVDDEIAFEAAEREHTPAA